MPPKGFKCKQCGKCCFFFDAYTTTVSDQDVKMWKKEKRYDILERVYSMHLGGGQYVHDIWVNSETGEDVQRCPWLRKLPKQDKYVCRIHNLKPKHCRNYPTSKERAEENSCKGFE